MSDRISDDIHWNLVTIHAHSFHLEHGPCLINITPLYQSASGYIPPTSLANRWFEHRQSCFHTRIFKALQVATSQLNSRQTIEIVTSLHRHLILMVAPGSTSWIIEQYSRALCPNNAVFFGQLFVLLLSEI